MEDPAPVRLLHHAALCRLSGASRRGWEISLYGRVAFYAELGAARSAAGASHDRGSPAEPPAVPGVAAGVVLQRERGAEPARGLFPELPSSERAVSTAG